MKDISKLTSSELLALTEPERLFAGEESLAKNQYRVLSRLWHPDLNKSPEAAAVFAHFSELYHQAIEKIKNGTWETPGLRKLTDVTGKKFEFKYRKKYPTELGEMYVGNHFVTYMIQKADADLVSNAKGVIKSFNYANNAMRSEIEKCLPRIYAELETQDHYVVAITKTPDMFLLRDVLDHCKGKIDPRHVAWILNTIYNIACYLKYSGLTHNAIGPDTYFISPSQHSGALLGGWWYAAPIGKNLTAAPQRTYIQANKYFTSKKAVTHLIDSELIKATGRELLGDINGSKLLADATIPNSMLNWLRIPGTENVIEDYKTWVEVLKNSFGERRFVDLNLQQSDIYKE
jgi:hypothetical protein